MKRAFDSAQRLAALLHPLGEVAVYQSGMSEPVKVFNRICLEEVDRATASRFSKPVLRDIGNGRTAKSSWIPFDDVFSFLVSIDTSAMTQLASFVQVPSSEPEQQPGKTQIEKRIGDYLDHHQLTPAALTRKQKQEIVLDLYQSGLFQIKDAAKVISDQMSLSRASVYNYLNWAKKIRKVRIHQVDTFTDKPFQGNPAGVVLEAERLDEETMRKITREMNLSETAFVLPSELADFRLRYFTPTGDEVKFCGHSTIGALFTIAHEKLFGVSGPGHYPFAVETGAGVIPMEVHLDSDEQASLSFESPPIHLEKYSASHEELEHAIGVETSILHPTTSLFLDTTNRVLLAMVEPLEALLKLVPDLKSLERYCRDHELVAVCLLTPHALDEKNHVHVRVFCPAVGIPEDPFTGCMQGALAVFLDQHKLLPKNTREFGVEQGHAVNRPGSTTVCFSQENGTYQATVHAQAVPFFSTEIHLS